MPHRHGNVFQSSATECYTCDHAGTPGGGAFPPAPTAQAGLMCPFEKKAGTALHLADSASFPVRRRGANRPLACGVPNSTPRPEAAQT